MRKRNHHKHDLKRRYGLSQEQFHTILQKQSGGCAICGGINLNGKRLSVDHKHGSIPILIRGLLCHSCNRGIGLLKDDPNLCILAARYLRKWERKHE